jgi:hypothetical protein
LPISSWSVNKHGCHWQFLFLIGRFLKIFDSETVRPNTVTFFRKHLWKVLYNISSFHPDWTKNMVAMENSCFWLAEIKKKIFSSETRMHNELLLSRNDVWEILYKISIFRVDHYAQHRQFLFVIGQLKNYFSKTILPN